jgi:hypothetical protein
MAQFKLGGGYCGLEKGQELRWNIAIATYGGRQELLWIGSNLRRYVQQSRAMNSQNRIYRKGVSFITALRSYTHEGTCIPEGWL